MTFSAGPDVTGTSLSMEKLRAKFGPLAMVLAVHALLFYSVYSGMLTRMVDQTIEHAVMVSFVAPPQPKSPPPAAPKTVPLAKLQPPLLPSVPVIQVAVQPQPNVISVTQTAAPVETAPAPAVVSAPAAPVAPTPAAPMPVAPTPAAPKTITSGVEYIQAPQPVYPPMSKRMGEQGKVILRILVSETGRPDQVQVQTSSGSARLDEAGRQAALRAVFKPHLEDGRAVAVYVIVPLNFQLAS